MYVKATAEYLPLNLTNTNFIVAHLQALDVFPLEYPKLYHSWGAGVRQKGLSDEV